MVCLVDSLCRSADLACGDIPAQQEALKISLRCGLWDIADKVCEENPELSKELAAARSMAAENIEENMVPFAEYVRKGREQGRRRPSLARRLAQKVCCCCSSSRADADLGDEDGRDLDAAVARERGGSRGRGSGCFACFRGRGAKDEGGQTSKSKDWGAGVDEAGRPVPPAGLLARICFPCAAFGAVCAPYYTETREKLVRLRNLYPLVALAQGVAMVWLSRHDLSRSTFDARSQMKLHDGGKQVVVEVPESNWTVPLVLSRQLVGLAAVFAMWVCWERQRYYRQLVSSPRLMQLGMLLLAVGNGAMFLHLQYHLRWHFTPVQGETWECVYYTCRSAAIGILCFGVKRSWWDLMTLVVVPATALVYLMAPLALRFVVFVVQMPLAAMLALKLFRCFQDVRLLLVPAFLVMIHMGLSCMLLFVHSVLLVVLRDLLADVVGCLLLCLCIWIIPSTIEWVEDEELADLQGIGDAETARQELDKVRVQHRVPKGYETLYEVNKARQDAKRLKELLTGHNPDMFAQLNRVYTPDLLGSDRGEVPTSPLTIEQRRADLYAMRGDILDTNRGGFDYSAFGAAKRSTPKPLGANSRFSDAPGKSIAQMDPRRSLDSSRAPSVASAGSVDLDVSGVSHLWRSPATPRSQAGGTTSHAQALSHAPHGRERSYSQMSDSSRASEGGMSASSASSSLFAGTSQGQPAAPRAVPDGFAIQLDKLPQEGRQLVLKESLREQVRQRASLAQAASPSSWGPAEEALRRNDSAMGGGSPGTVAGKAYEGRATPNGRPKKSPGGGRGNKPPPDAGPPLSSAGWGSLIKPAAPVAAPNAPALAALGASPQLGVIPLHFAGEDDAKSVASVSSVGGSLGTTLRRDFGFP